MGGLEYGKDIIYLVILFIKMKEFFLNILITKKHYILLALLVIMLFIVYYHVLSPSNFGSFSITLRYYLSALGTLLAVVVSFNTLALQNQLKNMPSNMNAMNSQLEHVQSIIEPVLNKRQKDNEKDKEYKSDTFENASIYFSDAIESMMIVVRDKAKSYLQDDESPKEGSGGGGKGEEEEFKNICKNIHQECSSRLSAYGKTNSVYSLLILSTTKYIQKMRFNNSANNEKAKDFYETFLKLQLLKSIIYGIYMRNTLANLSYEMLASAIPIITFIGIVASISNYESYDEFTLRVFFAISISSAAIPFLLLFIRIIPLLHLIKEASTIPFARK
ncbi:MAG: hypothetical protein M3M87_04235 [Thermoproteota archaeon]|nr:hypothetical protein [Thermoproteota archaeon]